LEPTTLKSGKITTLNLEEEKEIEPIRSGNVKKRKKPFQKTLSSGINDKIIGSKNQDTVGLNTNFEVVE